MDHSPVIEDAFFEVEYVGPDDSDEEEELVTGLQLHDSDNEVNDGDFEFYRNVPEQIVVGYNANLDVEVVELGSDIDTNYYPSSEELHTDYSSAEENNNIYPTFDPEKELFDSQFEIGKTFKNMSEFRKSVRNHGVVTRHNLKLKPNEENRAQAVCKKDCKWRIWASLNKKLGCIQVKSYTHTHSCFRDRSNRHCTAKYVAERYLETFKVDPEWNPKLIKKVVFDDLKLSINKVTIWRARRWSNILLHELDEHQMGKYFASFMLLGEYLLELL